MTAARIPVSVADLLRRPGHQRPMTVRAEIEDLRVSASGVPEGSDVSIELVLEAVGGVIVATGSATAEWQGDCRRCLRPVSGSVTAQMRELFEPHPSEGETYLLQGDQIDLEPMVREALLLELPLAPVCREDCVGLCPVCGGDRSEVDCDCLAQRRDPRWAALDDLKFDR